MAKFAREFGPRKAGGDAVHAAENMNLFVGNFDFEHHLASDGPRTPSAQILRLNHEMVFCLAAIAQPGDFLWTPEQPDPGFAAHLEQIGLPVLQFVSQVSEIPNEALVVPWGWSKSVESWARSHGWRIDAPPLDIVTEANSREFSSRLESEWNVGLPGSRSIRTVAELERALADAAQFASGFVIKANFGMSARERILVHRFPPDPRDVAWARRRLDRGEVLFFEPWVERVAEFGCQFSIGRTGPPVLEGITGLLTDALGVYRGSRLPVGAENPRPGLLDAGVLAVVDRAARRVQQLGYFGPLGIDAIQYRTPEGVLRWRPLQDINARLTMGRVALGLRRLVYAGERADWLHLRWPESATADERQMSNAFAPLASGARVIRTSPSEVGDDPVLLATALVTAPSAAQLDAIVSVA